jgi:hypothetical protein
MRGARIAAAPTHTATTAKRPGDGARGITGGEGGEQQQGGADRRPAAGCRPAGEIANATSSVAIAGSRRSSIGSAPDQPSCRDSAASASLACCSVVYTCPSARARTDEPEADAAQLAVAAHLGQHFRNPVATLDVDDCAVLHLPLPRDMVRVAKVINVNAKNVVSNLTRVVHLPRPQDADIGAPFPGQHAATSLRHRG